MNVFVFSDDFDGFRSLFCEAADEVANDGEEFVRLEDLVFDEAKERELFKGWAGPEGYDLDLKGKTFDSPETAEVWCAWKACAKSRATR